MNNSKFKSLAISLTLATTLTACGDNVKWVDNENTDTPPADIIVEKNVFADKFYFGNDFSYTNEMEDCKAVFREDGIEQDPYQLLASKGSNLARFRSWVNPGNWQSLISQPSSVSGGRKSQYSDLADNIEGMRRAKNAGMDTLLSLQLSDYWADPGHQSLPRAWESMFDDDELLAQAVYEYVTDVLNELDDEGLVPDIISIGNESNTGLLLNQSYTVTSRSDGGVDVSFSDGITADGARVAVLYNAGIKAVRDFSVGRDSQPQISLHMTVQAIQLSNSILNGEYARLIQELGVTDFDVIGLSYYPHFHADAVTSIDDLGRYIEQFKSAFPDYEVMIVETAYPWTFEWGDAYGNVLGTTDPAYAKPSQQNQLKFLADLTQEVIESGGIGVVYWEPTWVSTDCRDAWGQGSSWENATYFDFNNNNNIHIGADWMNLAYLTEKPGADDGIATRFVVDMSEADISKGVYIEGDFTADTRQPMVDLGNFVFAYDTYLPWGAEGEYVIANGLSENAVEIIPASCASGNTARRRFVQESASGEISSVWESCAEFNRPTAINVRVNVAMGSEDIGRLYIAGNFNDYAWEPMIPMEANGDPGIYSFIVSDVEPGTEFSYYLSKTFDGSNIETVPDACGQYNVRTMTLPTLQSSASLNTNWASCESFDYDNPAFPSLQVETTFTVDVTGVNTASGIYIVGTIPSDNGIAWEFQEMTAIDENTYTWTTTLIAGEYHGYYYLNAADWAAKEPIPANCTHREWDGARGFEVPYENTLVKEQSWGICDVESGETPVQEVTLVDFYLDATGVDTANGIYIVGTVTDDGAGNWLFEEMTLTPDGQYTWSRELPVGSYQSFYFVNSADWGAEFKEPIAEQCSHKDWAANRGIEIASDSTMVVERTWGVCQSGSDSPGSQNMSEVTFYLDASGVDTTDGIYIVGTVTDDGAGNWLFEPMSLSEVDGRYSWRAVFEVGSYQSFYFVNKADWGAEYKEPIPEQCSHKDWAANRGIEIAEQDSIVVERTWGICL